MLPLGNAANGTLSVGNTSSLALAANVRRKYACIANASDVDMWISFGEAAQIGYGIPLDAGGGFYEIGPENLWRGEIYVISVSGSGKAAGTLEMS